MKKLIFIFILFQSASCFYLLPAADGCNECHSKNPKMVRMHEELGFKDCFKCHGGGKIKPKEEIKDQMANDTLCSNCHKK